MDNLVILFGWFLHGFTKMSEAWGSSCDWQMNGSSNTSNFFWSSWPSLLLWFVVLVILYKCKMNGGLGSLRLEAAGALRTALVSAENLQLTLKSDLSLEEQALTNNHSSGNGEKPSSGYEKCSKITLESLFTLKSLWNKEFVSEMEKLDRDLVVFSAFLPSYFLCRNISVSLSACRLIRSFIQTLTWWYEPL